MLESDFRELLLLLFFFFFSLVLESESNNLNAAQYFDPIYMSILSRHVFVAGMNRRPKILIL